MDQGFPGSKRMNCLICRQAELVGGLTSVHLERGEMNYEINHVPARVCPNCAEAYVEEDVARTLLLQAAEISATGVLECVAEYNIPT
jgi:YgiT-type zinc finger domain-containing protein